MLITCNFQLNQPCGLDIVDLILTLSNDQHDFKDLLNLISKLSLRYMYQRSAVDREIRTSCCDDNLLVEPR